MSVRMAGLDGIVFAYTLCEKRGHHRWWVTGRTYRRDYGTVDLACRDCPAELMGLYEEDEERYVPRPKLLHDEGAGL